MKRIITLPALGLLAGLFLATGAANAQKIAVIDMQGALLATKDGQAAAAELKSKFGPKEEEFNKRQQQVAAKQEQYRKAANTMSEEAKAAADRDIQNQTRILQRDADDAKTDFQAEENRLLGGIMQKMQAVINKYATDNKLSMIVDMSTQPNNLLFADQASNITAQVIAAYDAAAGAAPAPAAAAPKPAPSAPAAAAPAARRPAPAAPAKP